MEATYYEIRRKSSGALLLGSQDRGTVVEELEEMGSLADLLVVEHYGWGKEWTTPNVAKWAEEAAQSQMDLEQDVLFNDYAEFLADGGIG